MTGIRPCIEKDEMGSNHFSGCKWRDVRLWIRSESTPGDVRHVRVII